MSDHKHHIPRLVLSKHAQSAVHGEGRLGRFNSWLAVKITKTVGTMWVAYLFAILAAISLPAALMSGNLIIIIGWIAQTFLQLVLLPIIMVGQNVQQAASDAQREADHETLLALHGLTAEVHTINEQQTVMLDEMRELLKGRSN